MILYIQILVNPFDSNYTNELIREIQLDTEEAAKV